MKKILLVLMVAMATQAHAQFLGSFFSQQSQKQKLMLAQIAGYETYLHGLKTGYNITEKGLNFAQELKGGTFNLHTTYLTSLEQVNPAVQNNPKGKAIAGLVQQIINRFTTEINWQQQQKQFSTAETAYLQKVYVNLEKKCQLDLVELNEVLTPGKLQLTDQQRLDRLDKLYAAMQDKYAFACSFTSKCHSLAMSRQHNKSNNDQVKKLYGIQ